MPARNLGRLSLALVAVLTLSLVLEHLGKPVGPHDESTQLLNASLVQRGAVPHIDFWSMYPPLNYCLNAWAFSILGTSVATARLVSVVLALAAISALLALSMAQHPRSPATALGVGLASLAVMGKSFQLPWWNEYAWGFLGLMSYLASLRKEERERRVWLLGSGTLLAICCLSKLNFGAYFLFAIVATEGIEILRSESRRDALQHALPRAVAFGLPLLLGFGSYLLYYRGSLGEVLDQVLVFPAIHLAEHRLVTLRHGEQVRFLVAAAVPIFWIHARAGSLTDASKSLPRRLGALAQGLMAIALMALVGRFAAELWPLMAVALLLLVTVLCWRARELDRVEKALLLAYAASLHYVFSRADLPHFTVLLPLTAALLPVLLRVARSSEVPGLRPVVLGLVVVVAVPWKLGAPFLEIDLEQNVPGLQTMKHGVRLLGLLPTLRHPGDAGYLMNESLPLSPTMRWMYPDHDELEAARYVHARTSPDEAVFIGVIDHSSAFLNSPRTYFMLGRPLGSRYAELEPGLSTERRTQQRVIEDLERNDVQWIILAANDPGDLDFQERRYRGSRRLDRYLRARFVEAETFRRYVVIRRR